MNTSESALDALPLDPTPDGGPIHRGGPFTAFIALSCGLTALGSAIILCRQGETWWAVLFSLILGAIAVRASWILVERFRHRAPLPHSHAILTDALGFRIHATCRDVAATVFLDPDQLQPGNSARLLCFVENYASRQRIACFRIGPHHQLGLVQPLRIELRLAAGQAAVYVVPLSFSSPLPPGEHDIPVMLKVRKPCGTGVRLVGTRRHLYDVWTVHFAAPFTVLDATALNPVAPIRPEEKARFISLASISESEPRLAALQTLLSS